MAKGPVPVPPIERLLQRIDVVDDCWVFQGATNGSGYGKIGDKNRKSVYVHRLSYEHYNDTTLKTAQQIDHTCHNSDVECEGGIDCLHRRCVNPDHLEIVDARTNLLRSKHTQTSKRSAVVRCVNGHIYNDVNTYVRPIRGGRDCKICRKARKQ